MAWLENYRLQAGSYKWVEICLQELSFFQPPAHIRFIALSAL
jgi:hypothetical protein